MPSRMEAPPRQRLARLIAVALALGLAPIAGACGASSDATAPDGRRIAVIVMENREYEDVIGNPRAPYLNSLARRYALAERYYGVTHPSLPNYIAIIGGATFGIHHDCVRCHVRGANLIDQLERANISWKGYMESMPRPCFSAQATIDQTGLYAKRHNPFAYFDTVWKDPERCAKVVPLTQLRADMAAGKLPRFLWITPNLCHDMHDCGYRAGDRFLEKWVPRILRKLGPKGVLFLTFDEGTTNARCCDGARGGHIVTIAAGPGARRKGRSSIGYTHYSLLRTIEDSWGLPRIRHARETSTASLARLLVPGGK
jgi:hypothetical protein